MTTIIDYIGKVKEIFNLEPDFYETAINDVIGTENPKIVKHYLIEAINEWEYYLDHGRFKAKTLKSEQMALLGISLDYHFNSKKTTTYQLQCVRSLVEDIDIKKIPTPRTTAAINQNDIPTEYSNPPPNKIDILRSHLKEYGFYELERVKRLTAVKQDELTKKLANADAPFVIAMLNYLGFIEYLEENYFDKKGDLYTHLESCLNKPFRTISGNIKSLDTTSTQHESERYSAWNYKDNVKEYYKNLIKRSMT